MAKRKAEDKPTPIAKFLETIRGVSKKIRIIVTIALIFTIATTGIVVYSFISPNKEGQLTTISESSLQKVIEINELSTVDYTYNATATKYLEGSVEEVEYYVAYEGTVTAGIDLHEIDYVIHKDEKIITITIPEVEIQSIRVDMGTMDYIFIKDRYETETISQEAYKLCKADLKKRIENEELLYTTARENAISSVEALFKPWIETVDKEFKVEIK